MPAPAGRATNELSNYVAFGVQTAKDTEATTFYFMKHLDGSGFDVEEDIQSEREGGDGQETGLRYKSMVKSDPQLVAYARPGLAGRIMAGVLGVDTVASVAAALQDHTAVPTLAAPYHTVEQRWADSLERTSNVKFTQVDVEFEAGKPLKITGQAISGGSVYARPVASALSPTRETLKPIMYPGASVVFAGAASYAVTKGKVSIKRAIDDGIQAAALNRDDVIETALDVDVDVTVKYVDQTLYQQAHFLGSTQIPADALGLATASLDIFARDSSGSYSFRLVDPLSQIVAAKVNKLDPDGKTMYLDLSMSNIKGSTYAVFAVTRTPDATSYVLGS